jgi:hypothetical protein
MPRHHERPKISLKSPVVYMQTFVLVDAGRELGRIEGYPGGDFFCTLLERLVGQLPPPKRDGLSLRRST